MRQREGFIFLSAPNSMTPSHIDPEHNFLLQIRGTKDMNVGGSWTPTRAAASSRRPSPRRQPQHGSAAPQRAQFALQPGEGVYVPPNAPHWVQNGPKVSVSLSITFRTPVTERGAIVHSVNRRLRKLRITPRPPGEHLGTDKAKFALHRGLKTLSRR